MLSMTNPSQRKSRGKNECLANTQIAVRNNKRAKNFRHESSAHRISAPHWKLNRNHQRTASMENRRTGTEQLPLNQCVSGKGSFVRQTIAPSFL